jgi:NeuD_NnaD: sugar O-acyltransferase, sialic acid O-acetyltransferase NeuD family
MLSSIRNVFKALYLKRLVKHGLVVGSDFQMEKGCNIDANFPWLIEIGNNVTFASNVCLLAHDGSTKKLVGYSKVGKVSIGDNVFIGYGSIVMPNVRIGNGCVVGANSVVTRSLPDGVVAAGSPAKVLMTVEEFAGRTKKATEGRGPYESEYLRGSITLDRIQQIREDLNGGMGLIL